MAKTKGLFEKIHKVPRPLLLSLFILSLLVSLFALRANNLHMVKLRNELYTADRNNADVNNALNNLRVYVYGHMNTNLSGGNNAIKPPIQLKYTYQRLADKAAAKVIRANTQLYTDAENYCQVAVPNGYYGAYRIPCVKDYLARHSLKALPPAIPPALYEFDFISPSWSPDFAGWSLVVTGVLFLVYVISLIHHHFFRGPEPKRKYL